MRLPRGYCVASRWLPKPPGLASLFDPEFTPAGRTDFTVDERAGVRLLEQRAVAALLLLLGLDHASRCAGREANENYFKVLTYAATASICDLLILCATGLMIADVSGIFGFWPRSLPQFTNLSMT